MQTRPEPDHPSVQTNSFSTWESESEPGPEGPGFSPRCTVTVTRLSAHFVPARPGVGARGGAMNVDLKALAGPRDRLMADGSVDPVTAEVIRGAMETMCFEMAMYVSRTATTPILNQSNERNATIRDGKGRLAALSVGIPQFMLTSTLPVRFALDFLGVEEFHQGDVFVANDPYHGGGHLPDYNVFSPVVVDGRLILIASIQCHHGDTGGAVPGGYNVTATDIWGEGVG